MHLRQGGDHSGVAFVGGDAERAVFRNTEVRSGNAYLAFDEFASELHTGDFDKALNIFRIVFFAGNFA